MIRNYRDLTRWEMEQVDRENTIVLIPLGALEQHGNQAPLGTDDIIAEAMSQEIKKALEAEGEEDFPMLLFPVIPVGLSTEHKNFCGSVTVRPDTYYHASAWRITVLRSWLFWYAMVGMRRLRRF